VYIVVTFSYLQLSLTVLLVVVTGDVSFYDRTANTLQ